MAELKVVIIDDDRERREKVRNVLPDYMAGVVTGSGEGAIDNIKPDREGVVPDLIILNGDDRKSFGLYVFDWMLNKSPDPRTADIPVIVLTEDEFSDRSLEFLELGDVTFYEGEIDESSLFTVINEALEEAEFMTEPVEPAYEETKSIDRLMGLSIKAPGSAEKQRAVVLDMETRLKNLEAALERGKKRVSDIRTLLDAAQKVKGGNDELGIRRRSRRDPAAEEAYVKRMSSFLEKAREKARAEEERLSRMKEQYSPSPSKSEGEIADSLGRLKQKAISNPYGAFNAQGTLTVDQRPRRREEPAPGDKKTVVIVDGDVKTRKLCSLYLTQKYNVVSLDSGMKTVDLFVKSHADLLIINPVLNGMSGMTTVASVRMQPGCMNVPVMYLVGEDYTDDRSTLLGNGVVGILNKPVKREVLAQAVEGYFKTSDPV